jgi:hypothetical protein
MPCCCKIQPSWCSRPILPSQTQNASPLPCCLQVAGPPPLDLSALQVTESSGPHGSHGPQASSPHSVICPEPKARPFAQAQHGHSLSSPDVTALPHRVKRLPSPTSVLSGELPHPLCGPLPPAATRCAAWYARLKGHLWAHNADPFKAD